MNDGHFINLNHYMNFISPSRNLYKAGKQTRPIEQNEQKLISA